MYGLSLANRDLSQRFMRARTLWLYFTSHLLVQSFKSIWKYWTVLIESIKDWAFSDRFGSLVEFNFYETEEELKLTLAPLGNNCNNKLPEYYLMFHLVQMQETYCIPLQQLQYHTVYMLVSLLYTPNNPWCLSRRKKLTHESYEYTVTCSPIQSGGINNMTQMHEMTLCIIWRKGRRNEKGQSW